MKLYIMYDALFDVDFAIIKLMERKMRNSKLLQKDIYQYSDNQIKHLLLMRKKENPLSLIFWEYDDRLYDEIYSKYCDEIYKNITMNDIMRLVKVYSTMFNTDDISIVCKNEYDKTHITKRIEHTILNMCNIIENEKLGSNIAKDDYIIINKPREFLSNHRDFNGYNIYLFKTKYTVRFDSTLDSFIYHDDIFELINNCNVQLIEPYIFDKSYNINKRGLKNYGQKTND